MSAHTAVLWGELFNEVGEAQWGALLAWVESGSYFEDADGLPDFSSFEDRYRGCWPSFSEFLTEEVELLQEAWPDEAVRYFDWDAYERDARFDFTVLDAPHGEVYVFVDL